jgi:hypothetical protein
MPTGGEVLKSFVSNYFSNEPHIWLPHGTRKRDSRKVNGGWQITAT